MRGDYWSSPDNSKKNSRSTHSWVQRESVHGRPEGSFIFFIYFFFVSPNEAKKKKEKKEIICLTNVCFSFVLTSLNSKILENIAYTFHSYTLHIQFIHIHFIHIHCIYISSIHTHCITGSHDGFLISSLFISVRRDGI